MIANPFRLSNLWLSFSNIFNIPYSILAFLNLNLRRCRVFLWRSIGGGIVCRRLLLGRVLEDLDQRRIDCFGPIFLIKQSKSSCEFDEWLWPSGFLIIPCDLPWYFWELLDSLTNSKKIGGFLIKFWRNCKDRFLEERASDFASARNHEFGLISFRIKKKNKEFLYCSIWFFLFSFLNIRPI